MVASRYRNCLYYFFINKTFADHEFYVAKVDIEQIAVLDFFGGIKYVTVEDYFNAYNNSPNPQDIPFDDVHVIEVTF